MKPAATASFVRSLNGLPHVLPATSCSSAAARGSCEDDETAAPKSWSSWFSSAGAGAGCEDNETAAAALGDAAKSGFSGGSAGAGAGFEDVETPTLGSCGNMDI